MYSKTYHNQHWKASKQFPNATKERYSTQNAPRNRHWENLNRQAL